MPGHGPPTGNCRRRRRSGIWTSEERTSSPRLAANGPVHEHITRPAELQLAHLPESSSFIEPEGSCIICRERAGIVAIDVPSPEIGFDVLEQPGSPRSIL